MNSVSGFESPPAVRGPPGLLLVGQYDSPFTRRVGITLHEYSFDYARDTHSVYSEPDAVRALSPMTRIPALIVDGRHTLVDSSAIVDHLDELVGREHALAPAQGMARMEVLQLCAMSISITEKIAQIGYERQFHAPEHRSDYWERRCLAQITAGLAQLETAVGNGWLHRFGFSHADVMAGCMLTFLDDRLRRDIPLRDYPRLSSLRTWCESRASFRLTPLEK